MTYVRIIGHGILFEELDKIIEEDMFEQIRFNNNRLQGESEFMQVFPLSEEESEKDETVYPSSLPIIALKNTVLFPGIIIPITVGRSKSKESINKSYEGDKLIGVFSQIDKNTQDPGIDDLYHEGTIAKLVKILKMPDGNTTAILQGKKRSSLINITNTDPFLEAEVELLEEDEVKDQLELDALATSIRELSRQIIELSPQIPNDAVVMLDNIKSHSFLFNFIASNLNTDVQNKQIILAENNLFAKGSMILEKMDKELQMLQIKGQIENKVRGDIEKQQRDFYLNQQLKTIQDELGQNPNSEDILKLKEKAKDKKWSPEAQKQFDKEIKRLQRINPQIAEYSLTLSYLERIVELPWQHFSKDNFNLKKVRTTLDKDHYGLDDIKDRIIEHLAVLKLKKDMKAPILCLVGPPGVGKTSLGKSIAKSINREYIRMSLGGLHDESEIRGHRKTYIGAMPGRIIQSIQKAGTSNPVFILDEIDKIGNNFRGDPSSALLEVLDPEQNHSFYDNYLELEYDLSKVMFIATANSLNTIQPALRDRLEIIQLSGYSTPEKVEIAKKHLIQKQLSDHGLTPKNVSIPKTIVSKIIEGHTREAGVRNLSRKLANVMRHYAKKVAMDEGDTFKVDEENLKEILGVARFKKDDQSKIDTSGVAIGLAWTQVGGDILFIESSLSDGKGKLTLTGNLGDVMKESATTALSFIKANASSLGIDSSLFKEKDIHIHVPEGAIPKDGPSAGITMLSALSSLFTGKKVKSKLAMTGEITLRGKVLPVGGIKEKVLAAKRSGVKQIILCKENKKDIDKINEAYLKGVQFTFVENMGEVLSHALVK